MYCYLSGRKPFQYVQIPFILLPRRNGNALFLQVLQLFLLSGLLVEAGLALQMVLLEKNLEDLMIGVFILLRIAVLVCLFYEMSL